MADEEKDLTEEILAKKYPPNKKEVREPKPEKKPVAKKLEKVVTHPVKERKKSFSKKVAEAFLGEDGRSVGDYVLKDILIPAAKDLISDMVGGGMDMLLFGERRRGRGGYSRGRDNGPYVNYGASYYGGNRNRDNRDRDDRDRRDGRDLSRRARSTHDFRELAIDNRREAEDVREKLRERIYEYGETTVKDFYDLVGVTGDFPDEQYGWTNLDDCPIIPTRDRRYIIDFPPTQYLER